MGNKNENVEEAEKKDDDKNENAEEAENKDEDNKKENVEKAEDKEDDNKANKGQLHWTQGGVDKIKEQEVWTKYGSPEVGGDVSETVLEVVRTTGAVDDFVARGYWA